MKGNVRGTLKRFALQTVEYLSIFPIIFLGCMYMHHSSLYEKRENLQQFHTF